VYAEFVHAVPQLLLAGLTESVEKDVLPVPLWGLKTRVRVNGFMKMLPVHLVCFSSFRKVDGVRKTISFAVMTALLVV
jgi:hypothetical protein